MTCREKILSNEYVDVITDFMIPEEIIRVPREEYCQTTLEPDLQISYINRRYVERPTISVLRYNSIPKCYGLMDADRVTPFQAAGESENTFISSRDRFDPQPLIESGIIKTNGAPLNLTGMGVIIAFIDTGERVIIMSS